MENQFLAEEVLLIYIHIEFEQRSLVKSLEVFFPSKFFFFTTSLLLHIKECIWYFSFLFSWVYSFLSVFYL